MKLQFQDNLDYQTEAVRAVCDIFEGQEVCNTLFTVTRDQSLPLFPNESRSQLVLLLDARCVADTAPSTRDRVDLGGKKYACADGRSIDIWRYDNDIVTTLRGYPRHSHAHCMAAFCPSTGVLLVIPNPEAP